MLQSKPDNAQQAVSDETTLHAPTQNSKASMMASGFHSAGAAKFGRERTAAGGLCCIAAFFEDVPGLSHVLTAETDRQLIACVSRKTKVLLLLPPPPPPPPGIIIVLLPRFIFMIFIRSFRFDSFEGGPLKNNVQFAHRQTTNKKNSFPRKPKKLTPPPTRRLAPHPPPV